MVPFPITPMQNINRIEVSPSLFVSGKRHHEYGIDVYNSTGVKHFLPIPVLNQLLLETQSFYDVYISQNCPQFFCNTSATEFILAEGLTAFDNDPDERKRFPGAFKNVAYLFNTESKAMLNITPNWYENIGAAHHT